MPKPTFEAFTVALRKALAQVDVPDKELNLLDAKGASFDIFEDGGVDSLDMLDVTFYIDKDLDIKLGLEKFLMDEGPKTVQALYDSTKQEADSPA